MLEALLRNKRMDTEPGGEFACRARVHQRLGPGKKPELPYQEVEQTLRALTLHYQLVEQIQGQVTAPASHRVNELEDPLFGQRRNGLAYGFAADDLLIG